MRSDEYGPSVEGPDDPERPDRGAAALAERLAGFYFAETLDFDTAEVVADAILANGAVFLPGPVEGAGKTRFWMDEDGTHWRSPEECGAPAVGGPCTLPRGHNVGRVDVPDNHAARAAFLPDAAELERLRRIEEAARAVVSTEDQFVQTYSGADGKAADAAMGYLRAALQPEGSAQG